MNPKKVYMDYGKTSRDVSMHEKNYNAYFFYSDLVLQEVEFTGGNVGASSHWSSSSYGAANAFKQTSEYWHSGRDADGKGAISQPFPHLIW